MTAVPAAGQPSPCPGDPLPRRRLAPALAPHSCHGRTALPPAIEVAGLAKRFGDVTAVDGISFAIRQGEIFGFLGPTGSRTCASALPCSS